MMRAVIFSFVKTSLDSVLPSMRIMRFLSEATGFPVVWDDRWDYKGKYDVLFIINGAYAFCQYLEVLAEVIPRAKRVVWIQNDYTIVPPKSSSKGESPFRKAFRVRFEKGLPDIELWTTVRGVTDGKLHHYINWNSLTYTPFKRQLTKEHLKDLFYYGSYRIFRAKAFDRFFVQDALYKINVSALGRKFTQVYPWLNVKEPVKENFHRSLARHGIGLYLEDTASHKNFHSPANRFYEMLSAQLPMVFQPESMPHLREAGFEIAPYVVTSQQDILYAIRHREDLRKSQAAQWHGEYTKDLRKRLKTLLQGIGAV